jgi:transcriptional antiterminator Rof (Rho-off)
MSLIKHPIEKTAPENWQISPDKNAPPIPLPKNIEEIIAQGQLIPDEKTPNPLFQLIRILWNTCQHRKLKKIDLIVYKPTLFGSNQTANTDSGKNQYMTMLCDVVDYLEHLLKPHHKNLKLDLVFGDILSSQAIRQFDCKASLFDQLCDSNNLEETKNAIESAVSNQKRSLNQSDIVIDVTGGTKIASLAGILAAIDKKGIATMYMDQKGQQTFFDVNTGETVTP